MHSIVYTRIISVAKFLSPGPEDILLPFYLVKLAAKYRPDSVEYLHKFCIELKDEYPSVAEKANLPYYLSSQLTIINLFFTYSYIKTK